MVTTLGERLEDEKKNRMGEKAFVIYFMVLDHKSEC